jgi:hypothetical protein
MSDVNIIVVLIFLEGQRRVTKIPSQYSVAYSIEIFWDDDDDDDYDDDIETVWPVNFQVIVVPILQSFGLLFRERFETLEISGTDASVIINVNSAFGMILGK